MEIKMKQGNVIKKVILIDVCIIILIIMIAIVKNFNHTEKITETVAETYTYDLNTELWQQRLYVPTMIKKEGNTYFIMDCWNSRILYNEVLSDDISTWKTLTDKNYLGGHTVASDGQLYVFDNTDMQQVLVYLKDSEGNFYLSQTIENIESRPHFVLYCKETDLFYVIGSGNGVLYCFKNINGNLDLVNQITLKEIETSYVRSISIFDGSLYTVSGPGKIYEYDLETLQLKNEYVVPDDFFGMNQIYKIDDTYFITVNTDMDGNVAATTIIKTSNLENLENGDYDEVYSLMGFVGQPYFITYFDERYWITQISENRGNGIKSFLFEDGEIKDVQNLFYWENTLNESHERWATQQKLYAGQTVDLFIFMGQSNMSGKGEATEAPLVEKGYEFRSISDPNKLYAISEPFGIYENNEEGINDVTEEGEYRKLGGMVSSFANTYYQTTGIPIVGVSSSEGNTSIDEWMPGTQFYTDIIQRLEKAESYLNSETEYHLRKVYMVWCQGESDGDKGMSSEEYYEKLNYFINSLISNTSIEKAFIIKIGNRADDLKLYDAIKNAQEKLCYDSENCILISRQFENMTNEEFMKDQYHYRQKAYNIVGEEAGKNAAEYILHYYN